MIRAIDDGRMGGKLDGTEKRLEEMPVREEDFRSLIEECRGLVKDE